MDNLNDKLSDETQNQPSCLGAVVRSCSFCQFYTHEEVGDSDYGAVYSENPSCSKYIDTDEETEEEIPNFDRDIERECCDLDFWRVIEFDKELAEHLEKEQEIGDGSFSETYELFRVRYNYA